MADTALVSEIAEWLVDQALSEPDIAEMFEGVCHRLHAVGVPIARARLIWPTLHPLFQAETVLWKRGEKTTLSQFAHQDIESDEWLRSPVKYLADHKVTVLRRRLDGPDKVVDFTLLEELAEQGLTDYLMIKTVFPGVVGGDAKSAPGVVVTWSPDRAGGFSDNDIATLKRIQRRFAVACKTAIQARIARNITETYLGRQAGDRVLRGEIRRGDGHATKAIVWYSDLRRSTALADTMSSEEFIGLLNCYFECSATPIIEAGGDVLDFVGDAVLAIFPYQGKDDLPAAARAAALAMRNSQKAVEATNARRKKAGLPDIRFGIGLNTGTVMFGNIGVPHRLSFSVIGPTVNEVARIEKLTKSVEPNALATKEIADLEPELWVSAGLHRLEGVSQKMELFALRDDPSALPLKRRAGAARTAAAPAGRQHH